MKIRAAVLRHSPVAPPYAVSRPLSIEEIELAPPGQDEILVRIGAAGLCHSDLSVINGDRPRPVPMALGHEAAGTVEAVGGGVTDLAPGDHVVMSFMPSCGHCLPCAEGRPALCIPGADANGRGTLLSGARRLSCAEVPIHHHLGVSGFATHAVVSRHSAIRIDADIPFTHAALFGCAVLTGVGAVVNTCRVQPGQTVAVVGLGGVGLAAVLGAVASGAERIIAVDLAPEKLGIALSLGATDGFVASDPDVVEQIREATKGGVDHALEMAGAAKAFDLAYRITRRGGTTAAAGLANPSSQFAISAVSLVADERRVLGSYLGSCVPSRDIPRFVGLFRRGKLPVDRLLSSTGPLEGINEAFDRLHAGEVIRHVIDFDSVF
ncbi:alcohol dehydrogenase catalytic domain-containing protein [Rhizobium grahamii]|uniref:Alcohol dehydrogenase catalytic domain-containing protein n=1 Tax=Rhizobium grahamii TaxID=1120045 RepID=A0A5Q0CBV5_9HYPH|nr:MULTISPECIES: zinc-dependent alcohol dehydrogenase family protein [Rhizobium]QFY61361.1 alcohol dehydrogenase catalytic domain-containing protein [Rhizobium grahamii]QRM49489.1 alcohol dehydrogenase catalytic domain-containing protein [Rhizobium sp. BG6]